MYHLKRRCLLPSEADVLEYVVIAKKVIDFICPQYISRKKTMGLCRDLHGVLCNFWTLIERSYEEDIDVWTSYLIAHLS